MPPRWKPRASVRSSSTSSIRRNQAHDHPLPRPPGRRHAPADRPVDPELRSERPPAHRRDAPPWSRLPTPAGVRRMIARAPPTPTSRGDEPADETTPLDYKAGWPRKRTVEAVVLLEQAVSEVEQAIILRYGVLYGPGTAASPATDRPPRASAAARPPPRAPSRFLHIEDAARRGRGALDWPAKRLPMIVNVVDDEPAAGIAWMPVLAGSLGAPAPAVDLQAPASGRAVSNAKARGPSAGRRVMPPGAPASPPRSRRYRADTARRHAVTISSPRPLSRGSPFAP